MAKCVVVCASEVTEQDWIEADVKPEDIIIVADGGYLRLEKLGVEPHVIVGDFDSAPVPEMKDIKIEIYPSHKDDTDCMIAVRRGWEFGLKDFVLLGTLGGTRLDHTLANLQTLDYISRMGGSGKIIAQGTYAQVIHNGSVTISRTDGKLSVFALGDSCSGVTLKGVEYPLTDYTLTCGYPLGVSNAFAQNEAEISVEHGGLLIVWTKDNI